MNKLKAFKQLTTLYLRAETSGIWLVVLTITVPATSIKEWFCPNIYWYHQKQSLLHQRRSWWNTLSSLHRKQAPGTFVLFTIWMPNKDVVVLFMSWGVQWCIGSVDLSNAVFDIKVIKTCIKIFWVTRIIHHYTSMHYYNFFVVIVAKNVGFSLSRSHFSTLLDPFVSTHLTSKRTLQRLVMLL